MRHGKKVNHLSRTSSHRKAMLANMACSLIEHKRINTTIAKAKALKKFVEPLITKSKSDTTHSRRMVFKSLRSKQGAAELFRDVAPKIADRPGGYTRIIKLGSRLGDNAEMAMIELVDFNELLLEGAAPKKKSRRRGKKKAEGAVAETAEVVEEVKTEVAEEVKEEAKAEEAVVTEEVKEEKAEEVVAETTEDVVEEKAPEAKAEESAPKEEEEKKEEGDDKKEE
jgi:large subunit ribosomal protein L17